MHWWTFVEEESVRGSRFDQTRRRTRRRREEEGERNERRAAAQ